MGNPMIARIRKENQDEKLVRVLTRKLGTHKGHSRLYLQGKYLSEAGFTPSSMMKMEIKKDSIELIIDAENGTKKVSKKSKSGSLISVIDLLTNELKNKFRDDLEIRVYENKIILIPSLSARKKSERDFKRSHSGKTCGSIYAGIGMLTHAAKSTHTEKWAIEMDQDFADVYKENNPESLVLNQSVIDVNPEDLSWVDTILLGQPCEVWSPKRRSGNKAHKKGQHYEEDERSSLLFYSLNIINFLNPTTVVCECSKAFNSSAGGHIFKNTLKSFGYKIFETIMDSHEYGSIQSRKRSVIIAYSSESDYIPPHKTQNELTIKDIIVHDELDHKWFDETTESKRWLFEHFRKQTERGNSFCKNLFFDENDSKIGAITKGYVKVQGDNQLLRNDKGQYRLFTIKELMNLFELDSDFKMSCPKTTAGAGLGQGVVVGPWRQFIEKIAFSFTGEILPPSETNVAQKNQKTDVVFEIKYNAPNLLEGSKKMIEDKSDFSSLYQPELF